MTQEINSYSKMLSLDYDVRISASSSFNAQAAYENTFEDVISEKTMQQEFEKKKLTSNSTMLGAPPGFWMEDGTSATCKDIFLNRSSAADTLLLEDLK